MSDGKPLNDWVKDFEALQRQYLAAWSDLMQKSPTSAPSPAFSMPFGSIPGMFGGAQMPPAPPPWHEGLEQWARLFGNKGAQSETAERVVESGKAYVEMIRAMLGGASAAGGFANPGQAWADAMRGGFNPSAFSMPGMDAASNPFIKAVRDIVGKGAQGLGELPAAFAPFLEQFRNENLSWLRMPAFGLAREHQEHYQHTALAFFEYQGALRNYNALLLKSSQRGLELLEGKLAERSEPGRAIDSPRALYDLWVDCAEEAYAEIALSDEFAKAYGELANAQMRMRSHIQAEVERIGTDLGMPTRSELNSVHQRLHDLRREFRDSRGESHAIEDLETQIAELRVEVARLKSPSASAPAPKPVANAVARSAPRPPRKAEVKPAEPSVPQRERVVSTRDIAAKPKRSVKPAKASAARTRRGGRRSSAPRAQPVAAAKAAPAQKSVSAPAPASFGDAIAAMRKRVAKSGRVKSAAAKVSLPQKADKGAKASRKSAKRK